MLDGLRDHHEPLPWRALWLPLLPVALGLGMLAGCVLVVVKGAM